MINLDCSGLFRLKHTYCTGFMQWTANAPFGRLWLGSGGWMYRVSGLMRLIFHVVCWFVWCSADCGFCVWLNVMLQHSELKVLQHYMTMSPITLNCVSPASSPSLLFRTRSSWRIKIPTSSATTVTWLWCLATRPRWPTGRRAARLRRRGGAQMAKGLAAPPRRPWSERWTLGNRSC